jgi:ATP/maltotriose-dependent transcriptional regulator MalT
MSLEQLSVLREAMEHYDWQAAFDGARDGSFADPVSEAERLDLLAEAAWWLGNLEDCISNREAAFAAWTAVGEARRSGQRAVWLYEHHLFRARPRIAQAWLRRARLVLEPHSETEEYGALLLREVELAHGSGDLGQAVLISRSVVNLGRRLGSPDLEAEALQTLGRLLIDQGDPEAGMASLDDAMLIAVQGLLRPYSTGKVYCSLISACEELGDLARASEWTDATARWSEQHPRAIFPGICRVHHAVVLKQRGALAEAAEEARRAGEELTASHLPNAAAAYQEVGDILRRLGDLDAAADAFAKASEMAGGLCGGYALVLLAQGRTQEARATVDRCRAGCGPSPLAKAKLLPVFVQVAIAGGDLDAAEAAAVELDQISEAYPSTYLSATARSTRGRVQLATGDPSAVSTIGEACRAWQMLGVPYEVATTRTLLGLALRNSGDDRGAVAAFAEASATFDEIGASLDASIAGGGAMPTSLPAGLTQREVEVLRLLATGMSNAEMAEALYLSVKTVSRHMSNIFVKIGVTSRAAATAFAFENGVVTPGD